MGIRGKAESNEPENEIAGLNEKYIVLEVQVLSRMKSLPDASLLLGFW